MGEPLPIAADPLHDPHLSIPQNVLPRKRITERLLEAAHYPIVLVVAPAGFGKTTAIRHFLAQFETVVFVSTPQGATLEQFAHTFASACSRHFPEMESPPRESPNGATNTESNLDLYTAWATTHLRNATCTIAIDDLQNAENSNVTAFLSRLADSLNETVKWVFASRTRGTLPITRWQAYGNADAAVNADDLRMTLDESLRLATSLKSPATEADIASLVEQTHGFPVLLTYAIRLSARRGSLADVTEGTRSFTFAFFAEQLWDSLASRERALLEVASFLPPIHFYALECPGYEGASSTIRRLCNDIAFLSLTKDGIFSLHDLFRDFVRQQVSLAGPTEFRQRCSSAVDVLMKAKRYNDGFQLLIETHDIAMLLQAVELFGRHVTDLSVRHKIINATEHLPIKTLGLEALHIQTEYWSWFDEPHKACTRAEEIVRRNNADSRHILCSLRAIYRAIDTQPLEEQREWVNRVSEIACRLNEKDRTQAHACQGSLLARFPEKSAEARSLILQAQQQVMALESHAQIDVYIALAAAFYYLGENESALRATRKAVEIAKTVNDPREIARTLNSFGLTLICVYDPEVELVFDPLREAVERTGSWRFSQISHLIQAIYYAWRGDVKTSTEFCELQLKVFSNEVGRSRIKAMRRHTRNLCHLINGDFHSIIQDYASGLPKEVDVAYELLTDAALAFASLSRMEECELTLKHLKQLRESCPSVLDNSGRLALFVEIIALGISGRWSQAKRLSEWQRGTIPALAPLEEAVSAYCQGSPFIGVTEPLRQCLGKPYVGFIALLMKRVVESSKRATDTLLSAAEIDVLRLLAIGRSNKAIASNRSRSVETVKRQVSSLYRKLGVDNRTSAVAVARDRGLL